MIAIFMMAVGVALLLIDDLIPGGQADDVLIPPLIVKLAEKLAPLLVMLGPVVPPPPPPTPMPTPVPIHEGEFDDE